MNKSMKFIPFTNLISKRPSSLIYDIIVLHDNGQTSKVNENTDWDTVLGYCFADKKSPIAPGHNPHGVTIDQVEPGWRLLDIDELKVRKESKYIQFWSYHNRWIEDEATGMFYNMTYRTKLSREQLRLLDEDNSWIPWFGDENPPDAVTDRYDIVFRNGKIYTNESSMNEMRWYHKDNDYDIIAYRPTKKEEPTYVPYTKETCPTLPFEVITKKYGNRTTVLSAADSHVYVASWGNIFWDTLFEKFTHVNGTPCGTKK